MKLSLTVLALAASFQAATARFTGINIKSQNEDGSCKTVADWTVAFAHMRTLPNHLASARLFSSARCNTLQNAIPAALQSKVKIMVGVEGGRDYVAEKAALVAAVTKYGTGWIAAISVGSEELYRKSVNATQMVTQIKDIRRTMWSTPGFHRRIKIGHVDTTNIWTNTTNYDVIRACDFVGTDIYPYFQRLQHNNISNANFHLFHGVQQVKDAVALAGGKAQVWVTETGWPVNGTTIGEAEASVANARQFWKTAVCPALKTLNIWIYTLEDWNSLPNFSLLGPNGKPLYSLKC
jgi:glucan endo-1,3-beta-D-glucosidase